MTNDSHHNDNDRYCQDLVRRYDRDRYLCALFTADEVRPDIMALLAFNIEISGTRETVSQPMIGQMRLKWWFDALDGIYEGVPPVHQVAVPLSNAVARGRIRRNLLEDLVDARLLDLDDKPTPSMDALIDYANRTSGALSEAVLEGLGIDADGAIEAARHVGIAYALTGMVRALPINFAKRRVFLPADLCRDEGLEIDTLLDRGMKDGAPPEMIRALNRVIDGAEQQLSKADNRKAEVPRRGVSALMPGVLARGYLKELAKHGNDPFKQPLRPPGPKVGGMLGLLWAGVRGTI